jgi:PAS domain-containing protein
MNKNVWEIIWDYDPNGLLVINENLEIQIVNPAFAKYFNLEYS